MSFKGNDTKEGVGFNSSYSTAMEVHKWCVLFHHALDAGNLIEARKKLKMVITSSDFCLLEKQREEVNKSFENINIAFNKCKNPQGNFDIKDVDVPEFVKSIEDGYKVLRRHLYDRKLIMTGDPFAKRAMF